MFKKRQTKPIQIDVDVSAVVSLLAIADKETVAKIYQAAVVSYLIMPPELRKKLIEKSSDVMVQFISDNFEYFDSLKTRRDKGFSLAKSNKLYVANNPNNINLSKAQIQNLQLGDLVEAMFPGILEKTKNVAELSRSLPRPDF